MKERKIRFSGLTFQMALPFLIFALMLSACDGNQADNGPAADNESPPSGNGGEEAPPSPVDAALTTLIPAGEFWFGSPTTDPDANEDEFVQHQVFLPDFVIYTFEVSNLMYAQCVEEGSCTVPHQPEEGDPQYGDPEFYEFPVVNVDWQQAQDYCHWADGRLPTEAEWEKAARGEDAYTYPWGEDDPTCDLTNMQDCAGDLEKAKTHEEGQSPWGVFNMSGNAFEWVNDWYSPVSYGYTLISNPGGAPFGDLKVVRGGSFEDGPLSQRTAARSAMDPDLFNDYTGFRCVLIGETPIAYAPFCSPTYTPFCTPEVCDPELRPNISVVALGCPQGNRTAISVDTGLPNTQGLSLNVNGLPYENCYEDPNYPGRLYCEGTSPPVGFEVKVTVCSDSCEEEQVLASAIQPELVSLDTSYLGPLLEGSLLQTDPADGMNGYCPEGYEFVEGQCRLITTGDNCYPGWSYNPETFQCEPDNQEECPEGTHYATSVAGLPGCQPEDGQECPEGYTYNRLTQTCDPPQNQDGFCMPGYYFNRDINCCIPFERDNFGCEDGEYYQPAGVANQTTLAAYFPGEEGCQPITWDGCAQGSHYDRQMGCVPDTPQNPPNETNTRGNCPEGTLINDAGACVPVDGGTPPECSEGSTYNPYLLRCVQENGGQNDCGPGYTLAAANLETCTPNDGPGSTCGYGYTYNPRLNCCVPDPGTPGGDCLDGQQNELNMAYFSTGLTSYNYFAGFCTDGECPEGYYLDTADNTCKPIQDSCPDGTQLRAFDQLCEPTTPGKCPEGTTFSYANNACFPDGQDIPDCGEGMYFDPAVGYCLDTSSNGCAPGYLLSTANQTCVPESGASSTSGEQQCPPGSHFDTRQQDCTPDGEGGQCWTILVTVPDCQEPQNPGDLCPPGHPYNARTGTCAQDPTGGSGCITTNCRP